MSDSKIVQSLIKQMEETIREYQAKVTEINRAMDQIEVYQREATDLAALHEKLYEAANVLAERQGNRVLLPVLSKDTITEARPEEAPKSDNRPVVPVVPPTRGSRADRFAQFRDWVVKYSDHRNGFIKTEVQEALQRKTVDWMIQMGLERGLIEKAGYRPSGSRGRNPILYRYVQAVKATPLTPTSNGSAEAVVHTGSGPVALSTTKIPKELMEVVRPALRAGASISRTGSGHFKLEEPGKQPLIIASTPSDRRSQKNLRAQMRRHRYCVS